MWKKLNLTTASDNEKISFVGNGSIYAEGTFGGGTIQIAIVVIDPDNSVPTISSGFLTSVIDGTTVKTVQVPSGLYQLTLSGSTGGDVDVYYNDQIELVRN